MKREERVPTAGVAGGSDRLLAIPFSRRAVEKIVSGFRNRGYQGVKPMLDDAELLRSYADARSEVAFAELVRRHVDLVYSAALRRVGGDSHLAEDVCQKVFVALARQAESLTDRALLTGWLYTTARFAAAEVVRTERRRRAREQEAFVMHELFGNSALDPDWEKLRPVLDNAMDQLNECDREALLLRFFENRPLAEVGRQLAVTEEAARKRVDRALEKLRSLLAKKGVSSTAAAMGLMLANQTVTAAPAPFAAAVTTSAISAASAAVTPFAGVLHLMNASKIAAGVAGVVLALTVGVATYENRERRGFEAQLISANRDFNGMVAQRRELEQLARTAESERERMKKALDDAQAAEAAAKARIMAEAAAAKEAAAWNPAVEGRAFLARHPEVRQSLLDFQNAKVDFKYAGLYRVRSLTPVQIEQFRALMRENAPTSWNLNGFGKALVLSVGENLPYAEITPRLTALLGEQGMQEMIKTQTAAYGRDFTVRIAANLHFTESPITKEQADALTKIINRHRNLKLSSGARVVDWNSASSEIRGALSESQFSAFEAVRAQDEASQMFATQIQK